MRTRALLAASLATLISGCLDVGTDASVDLTDDISWDLGDGGAACAGTSHQGGTTTQYTLQPNGTCRLDISWSGTFLDVAMVKDAIKKNVDGYPDNVDVTVTNIGAQFTHINLTDGGGGDVTPAITPHFQAGLVVGTISAASFAGDDVAAFITQVRNIDLSSLVDPTNTALSANTNLAGTGTAVIVFDAASYARIATLHGVHLTFHADLHFDVHGSESLLNFL